MKTLYRTWMTIGFFLLLVTGCCILGSGEVPWESVRKGVLLRMQGLSVSWNPLLDERFPRLIVLFCTGASLAVSGAVVQSLFYNPLAAPSILGISSGGCLAVILLFVFDIGATRHYSVPLAAFCGSFAVLCLVYALSRSTEERSMKNLILTGIAVSTLLTAVQGLILYAIRDNWQLIRMISEWEAGSFTDRHFAHVHMQLPLTIVGLAGCLVYRKELNLLALGDEEALALGVDVGRVRWHLFFCVALLTGGALAAAGPIAFFGLIVPHVVRRLVGCNHLFLIPLCIVGGAVILAAVEILLKALHWEDVSIGGFSAVIGGAFFLYLLFKPEKGRAAAQ